MNAVRDDALLSVRDLRVTMRGTALVRGLSFDAYAGETLAVLGESGAGKSLTAQALLGLTPPGAHVEGELRFDGVPVTGRRELWGRRIAYVPQDALTALSPVHTVGAQLAAAVRSVRGGSRRDAWRTAVQALEQVGIPDAERRARACPHEFSGGMRQRAVIAMATVHEPDLLVADEPTTALDPLVQARILETLASVRESTGAALVLVTHDLAVAAQYADRVLVMYAGRAVETGPAERVLTQPGAPYTAGLLASAPPWPESRSGDAKVLPEIGGTPPQPHALPAGCPFAPRCPLASDECREHEPEPRPLPDGHLVACHRTEALPMPATDLYLRSTV